MGELQWALLIVCVVLVIALYVLSRRNADNVGNEEDKHNPFGRREAGGGQMDLLSPDPNSGFDEFGVGRKRTRGDEHAQAKTPASSDDVTAAPRAAEHGREPPEPSLATLLNPLPGQAPVKPRRAPVASPESAPATAGASAEKVVALIVAPSEETDILGPQLHAALREQGLKYGEGGVYHRMVGGQPVYSVASLLKPGKLDPEEAEGFSTKGLTVVLQLPGPLKPLIALDDMLETTVALSRALRADIYNAQREKLDQARGTALRDDVAAWATANPSA